MRIGRYTLPVIISLGVMLVILGLAGCRTDHYALVRVSLRDIDTGELVTNGIAKVSCSFESYSILRALGWQSQLSDVTEKDFRDEDRGIRWFWGHGDTNRAFAYVSVAPEGYYLTNAKRDKAKVHFSFLMTYIPIPLHLPPLGFATVYVKRQFDPIEAEVRHINDVRSPFVNGVSLVEYNPNRYSKRPIITDDYEFTAGYDCVKGDYCPPYGNGEMVDILFTHSYQYKGEITNKFGSVEHEYVKKRIMEFPGDGNGFIFREKPSRMNGREYTKDDFMAPEDGYQQSGESSYGRRESTGQTYVTFDFRIRCQYDDGGNITSCHYGRFDGRYGYDQGIYANYYINPKPLDRNLEIIHGKISGSGRGWYW